MQCSRPDSVAPEPLACALHSFTHSPFTLHPSPFTLHPSPLASRLPLLPGCFPDRYNLASLARRRASWPIDGNWQEAKNRLSELVRKAREEGPAGHHRARPGRGSHRFGGSLPQASSTKGITCRVLPEVPIGGRWARSEPQSRHGPRRRPMKFLLDSSLVSEMVKPAPHAGVLRWLAQCDEERLFLSVLTIGELEKGIAKLDDSRRRSRLANWVHKDLVSRFGSRLLSVDLAVAVRSGTVVGDSERRGQPLPVMDSLIAATCPRARADRGDAQPGRFRARWGSMLRPLGGSVAP